MEKIIALDKYAEKQSEEFYCEFVSCWETEGSPLQSPQTPASPSNKFYIFIKLHLQNVSPYVIREVKSTDSIHVNTKPFQ